MTHRSRRPDACWWTTRNRSHRRLVHPKDAGEPYRAWRLVTEYGELLLLHRIGYKGKYLSRTDTGEWANSIPVPWEAADEWA